MTAAIDRDGSFPRRWGGLPFRGSLDRGRLGGPRSGLRHGGNERGAHRRLAEARLGVGGLEGRPSLWQLWVAVGSLTASMACGSTSEEPSSLVEVVDSLCLRVAQCADTTFDAEEMQSCRSVAATFGMVLPDPESFAECMNKLDCSALLGVEDDQTELQACIDLDPTSVRCGAEGLLACTNAGFCSEIDCEQACEIMGASDASCGESSDYSYDVCRCTR